jgi:Domain of unknown function (DUF5063)
MALSLETPVAQHFLSVANRYCALVDGHQTQSSRQLARDLEAMVVLLYHAGTELPEVEPDTVEANEGTGLPVDDFHALHRSLRVRFGAHDAYREIFDPADPEDREPVVGSLSIDLAEIYEDLRRSLSLADAGAGIAPADVLWQWQFAFASHWGRHAASALRVLNSLVRSELMPDETPSPSPA